MSLKTLFEKFSDLSSIQGETTSPFDFEQGVTILAVPEKMLPEISAEAETPEGTTLQLPEISKTAEIDVPKESSKHFKGDHKHLSTEDLKALIGWVEEQSKSSDVPPEARAYLLEWYKNLVDEFNQRSEPED